MSAYERTELFWGNQNIRYWSYYYIHPQTRKQYQIMGKRTTDPRNRINQQIKAKAAKETPKIPLAFKQDYKNINLDKDSEKRLRSKLSKQKRKIIDEATSMLQEQQREAHQQAVLQWNLKRRKRKQLEKDLLRYQVSTVQGGCPTDQEIEQARAYITSEHKKVKGRASLCQTLF